MTAWAAVLLAGVGSYLLRIGAVVALARSTPPAWLQRASALVMPAAFAGLAAGGLSGLLAGGPRQGAPVLVAALVTIWAARRWPAARAVLAGVAVLAAGMLVAAMADAVG